jgi:hypothetical protein
MEPENDEKEDSESLRSKLRDFENSDGDENSVGEISVDKNGWRLRRQKWGQQKRRRKRRRKFFGKTFREWCRFFTEWIIFYTTFFFVLLVTLEVFK